MKKRFKPGFAAAALTIILHTVVLAALALRASAPRPATPVPAPVFQVSVLASQEQKSGASVPVMTEMEDLVAAGLASNAGKELPKATLLAPADVAAMALEWENFLPQLSNTPLPLLENLPLIGSPAYFPASELQLRPSPEAPVIIPFPDAPLGRQKATAILLLYISAEGTVERAEVDESELPVEFEQAAITTFLQAKMRPGIKDGRAVPARMKIEVEFEAK